jgi:hypothetical protein
MLQIIYKVIMHTHDYKRLRNMWNNNNEWVDIYHTTMFTDFLITLIRYMHTHHYVRVRVTRRHFGLNALLHTQ